MLTPSEDELVWTHAYLPEHLPGFVTAISQAEPHLLDDYLCYYAEGVLIFVGYPLRSPLDERAMTDGLGSAVSRFKPRQVALLAPSIPLDRGLCQDRESDQYYRLDLSGLTIRAKVRNMIRRASREVEVETSDRLAGEHVRLISEFLASRELSQDMRYIYERIPAYVAAVPTVRVVGARSRTGELVAFDVVDFGARDYAFYQFNFRSKQANVPGASDLLLYTVAEAARLDGKAFLNLGLGIHTGVVHFKEKWGGTPFLAYEYCRYAPGRPGLFELLLRNL